MVKSSDNNGSSVPPFLLKVYEMVDDQASDAIISWTPSNASFVIWDMTQFSLQLLPKYFKHKNFSSFMRQLNIYGFRKIDTDRWEFANEGFIRGQKQLLNNIIRRKYSQAVDQKKSSQEKHMSDDAFQDIKTGLWKEVESLKIDKNALTQELVTLRQHQETADNKLLVLRERLQGMEKTQQQMLSFLVMAMQSPGILAQFLQPKEKNWRRTDAGKNMLEEVIEEEETLASDGMIVKYNPMMDDISKPLLPPASNSEESMEFDLSDGMKDLIVNVDFMKTMMDENLCSSENLSPFILPDLPDDGLLEQLLLGSPFSFPENTEDANLDSQEHIDSMEMEPTVGGTQVERFLNFNFQIEQVEKDQYLETESPPDRPQLENPQNLDF